VVIESRVRKDASMRLALVTGGARGLGLTTAARFARDGLTVVVADLDGPRAAEVAARLPGAGHRGIALDVSCEVMVAEVFAAIEAEVGPIAILAHFAGTLGKVSPIADCDLALWNNVQKVNSTGTFLCLRELMRYRRSNPVEHARIIAIASLAGQAGGLLSGAAYAASKGAVLALVRTAARELAPLGITVNAIAPGPVATPMLNELIGGEQPNVAGLPLGRVGEPHEVAAAAAYLASVDAGFVTGATIDVNGGLLMR
jgi:3-oxoacyl-[acyl-carrier protein] reductase